MLGKPTCIQYTNNTSTCGSGFVCYTFEQETDLVAELQELYLLGSTSHYVHPECAQNWDFTYISPPSNCHRMNEAMREYLRHFDVSDKDIDDICYVSNGQWYFQGHLKHKVTFVFEGGGMV
jgi:hypothetical protein